jgi:hypothetical protein
MLYELVVYVCLVGAQPSAETCRTFTFKQHPVTSEAQCAEVYERDEAQLSRIAGQSLIGPGQGSVEVQAFYTCKPKPSY